MIEASVLHRVRNGVCAVGFLTEPLQDFQRHLEIAGMFHVVGSGFLVREGLVITNRHVLDTLEEDQRARSIPDVQLFVLFVVPHHSIPQVAGVPFGRLCLTSEPPSRDGSPAASADGRTAGVA